jgi:hypothetical protein
MHDPIPRPLTAQQFIDGLSDYIFTFAYETQDGQTVLDGMTATMAHLMARATLDAQIPPHEVDAALDDWCQRLKALTKTIMQQLTTDRE